MITILTTYITILQAKNALSGIFSNVEITEENILNLLDGNEFSFLHDDKNGVFLLSGEVNKSDGSSLP